MASFPTSPHTFTGFSNGALSDAAQVTDIYAEVEAIEAGIINGTARVQSSNLSVLGTSTFASRPMEPPPAAARVVLASTVSVGDGVSTVVTWATGEYLTNSSLFSTPSSVITPQSTGIWQATAQVAFSPNSTGDRAVSILDSSGGTFGRMQAHASSHSGSPTILNVSATKRFDALGGSVKVQVYQASASTLSVIITDSFFELRKL